MTFLSEECPKAGKVLFPLMQHQAQAAFSEAEDSPQLKLWEMANHLFCMTTLREEATWLCPFNTSPENLHGALFGYNLMTTLGRNGDPVNDLLVYPGNNLFTFIGEFPKAELPLHLVFPQIYDFRNKDLEFTHMNPDYVDLSHMPQSISESYWFLNEKEALITKYPESKINSTKMTQLFCETGVPCEQIDSIEPKTNCDLLLLNSPTCLKWLNTLDCSYKKNKIALKVLFEKSDHEGTQ
jgi:hypothetical protein